MNIFTKRGCIENLQREDIHPLEEAQGFRALLELPDHSYTVALISERAGKTPAYIAGRLRLTELISDVADAFLSGRLTIGHAVLIAKLPPEQQYEAFKAAFKSTRMTGGQTEILVPTRESALWIESNLLLDLQTAPFDRSDAGLVPDAGSCHDCTKRTGANSLLFPESAHDQCLDRDCYQTKIGAHVAVSIERNPQLIQISSAWRTHSNGVLGGGQYVEIAAKASRNGQGKLPPQRKKCPHIAKAIATEGATVEASSMSAPIPPVRRITLNRGKRANRRSGCERRLVSRRKSADRKSRREAACWPPSSKRSRLR